MLKHIQLGLITSGFNIEVRTLSSSLSWSVIFVLNTPDGD